MTEETQVQNAEAAVAVAVDGMKVKYFFKTEKLRDAEGAEIGDGRKHPDVEAVLPKPTMAEVVAILTGEDTAARKMLVDAFEDIIYLAGRAQINDWREKNPEGVFTASNFDLDKLTLPAIALLPKKSRGGYSPSDEELKAFTEDYKQVMLHKVNYEPKKVGTHVKNLQQKLVKIKDEKRILERMREFLDTWLSQTDAAEEHAQVYEWFSERINKWLAREEKDLEAAF